MHTPFVLILGTTAASVLCLPQQLAPTPTPSHTPDITFNYNFGTKTGSMVADSGVNNGNDGLNKLASILHIRRASDQVPASDAPSPTASSHLTPSLAPFIDAAGNALWVEVDDLKSTGRLALPRPLGPFSVPPSSATSQPPSDPTQPPGLHNLMSLDYLSAYSALQSMFGVLDSAASSAGLPAPSNFFVAAPSASSAISSNPFPSASASPSIPIGPHYHPNKAQVNPDPFGLHSLFDGPYPTDSPRLLRRANASPAASRLTQRRTRRAMLKGWS